MIIYNFFNILDTKNVDYAFSFHSDYNYVLNFEVHRSCSFKYIWKYAMTGAVHHFMPLHIKAGYSMYNNHDKSMDSLIFVNLVF